MEHKNAFLYSGVIIEKREAKKKNGEIFGYEVAVAQIGEKLSFLVNREVSDSVSLGQEVEVRGRVTQSGYDVRLKVETIKPVAAPKAA